jgi:hypothetical protein
MREPQWCHEDGYKGMSLFIEPIDNPQRPLILEFPFTRNERRSTPHHQRPKINSKKLAEFISSAIAAGWKQSSRGKPYVFQVPKDA